MAEPVFQPGRRRISLPIQSLTYVLQPMEYAFLLAMGEEVGIQGSFNPGVTAGAPQVLNLLCDEVHIYPKQNGRGIDARVHSSFANPLEAEHRFIKTAVSRVDLDEHVGALVNVPAVDKNNVKERTHHQL